MNTRRTLVAVLTGIAVLAATAVAIGHEGRLDSNGGHQVRERGGYHFHRGPLAGQSFASKRDALAARREAREQQANERPSEQIARRGAGVLDVPYIGKILGGKPEEVLARKRILKPENDRDNRVIEKLAVETWSVSIYGMPSYRKVDFYVTKLAGAKIAGVSVSEGSIQRVVLHYDSMTKRKAEGILKRFGDLQTVEGSPANAWYKGTKTVDGVRVRFRLVRTAIHTNVRLPSGSPAIIRPHQAREGGPAHLVIDVPPVEWYLRQHDVEPKVAAAMLREEPIVGMTEAELHVVLQEKWPKHKVVGDDGSERQIEFYELFDGNRQQILRCIAWIDKTTGKVTSIAVP